MRFETNDLPALLWTGGALSAYLSGASPTAWRRYIHLMFDGFLADDDPARHAMTHKAPSADQIDAAMRGRNAT